MNIMGPSNMNIMGITYIHIYIHMHAYGHTCTHTNLLEECEL